MQYANRKKILLADYPVAGGIGAHPAAHHFYRYACGKNLPGNKTGFCFFQIN
jgi:hypothetical protein